MDASDVVDSGKEAAAAIDERLPPAAPRTSAKEVSSDVTTYSLPACPTTNEGRLSFSKDEPKYTHKPEHVASEMNAHNQRQPVSAPLREGAHTLTLPPHNPG